MRSSQSKPLLFISVSFFAILLTVFTVQISVNRSKEGSTKAGGPLPLENPVPEPKGSRSHDWTERLDVLSQRSFVFQRPEEALLERTEKPQNEYLFWEEIQDDLALIIREKFPGLILSQRDLQALTETIRTLQKSMLALGALERKRSHREEIQEIRGEVSRTLETFEEITQMSISDFILYGRPESGLDNGRPDDEELVEEYLDYF